MTAPDLFCFSPFSNVLPMAHVLELATNLEVRRSTQTERKQKSDWHSSWASHEQIAYRLKLNGKGKIASEDY